MFTGIIECIGIVERVIESGSNKDFIIRSDISNELKVDQSVAHNGVCLTVVSVDHELHTVNVVNESLERSNLREVEEGTLINLERSLKIGDRLDGHMVQGHVDTTVKCLSLEDHQGSWMIGFSVPDHPELLVQKGSICLNGVSLTIAELHQDSFSVAIIPYTFEHTSFSLMRVGNLVNVEYDVLGKYVQRRALIQNT